MTDRHSHAQIYLQTSCFGFLRSTNHKTEPYFDFDQSGFPRWIRMNFPYAHTCIQPHTRVYTHTHTYTHQQRVTLIECYSISDAAPSVIEEGGDGRMRAGDFALKGLGPFRCIMLQQRSSLVFIGAMPSNVGSIQFTQSLMRWRGGGWGVTEGKGNQSRHPPPLPASVMVCHTSAAPPRKVIFGRAYLISIRMVFISGC